MFVYSESICEIAALRWYLLGQLCRQALVALPFLPALFPSRLFHLAISALLPWMSWMSWMSWFFSYLYLLVLLLCEDYVVLVFCIALACLQCLLVAMSQFVDFVVSVFYYVVCLR